MNQTNFIAVRRLSFQLDSAAAADLCCSHGDILIQFFSPLNSQTTGRLSRQKALRSSDDGIFKQSHGLSRHFSAEFFHGEIRKIAHAFLSGA